MGSSYKNILDWGYKLFLGATLVYIAYELRSIQSMAKTHKEEINYVNSKLDYVTSDINIHQLKDNDN